ncbi:uncharacterized protein LOC141595469 [Silene latifolia]|uniref:uncharacterized protein LOC141595469 n=1 Tax=Silene latifolia TaxID=37657 RepID=UPI003D777369
MNSENKQKDIRWFLHNNNLGVFGLLETRVRASSINKVHQGLGTHWAMVNNISCHPGGRIWILWDAGNYAVEVISCEDQVTNTMVTYLPTGNVWWMSVVYGFNRVAERVPLWHSLVAMRSVVQGPWIIMGDFNNVLAMCERIGSEVTIAEMRGFQECVDMCGVVDIPAQGSFFMWNNKHEVGAMVFSRIDRAMVNDEWLLQYPDAITTFHPEGLYDHCPCTMNMTGVVARKKGSFKYYNMWGKDPGFLRIIKSVWDTHVPGYTMFQLTKFHLDPANLVLQQAEKEAANCYKEMACARYNFLQQKAKANWLADGDDNTKFFHSTIKARRLQNRVLCIQDLEGNVLTKTAAIEAAFESYYIQLLGTSKHVAPVHTPTLRNGKLVNAAQGINITAPVTDSEIKAALYFIPANKAPGPDGYSSKFYTDAFEVVEEDLIAAVKDFFSSLANCLLKLGPVLSEIVSETQSAFIKGRDIVDNILICHDLVRLYKRKSCSPRCLMKMTFSYFVGGDRPSIVTILRGFATFSVDSRLEMNKDKSDIYFNGMSPGDVEFVLRISGFQKGSFPFRYLGIPISHKRMAIGDCTRIEQICRNYLWSGADIYLKTPAVSWDKVCREKKYGGLGILHCKNWNIAMMGKYVWWLAQKSDHLWIRWVSHVYMKGKDWFDYQPTVNSSWTWRKVCQVRDILRPGYANGDWLATPGKYTTASGYQWLQGSQAKVSWIHTIWNKHITPKHSFIGWLAVQHRLLTKDRLLRFGLNIDGYCDLCLDQPEDQQHILYLCKFSTCCWDLLKDWLHINLPSIGILEWVSSWRCRSLSQKRRAIVAILAMIYSIWNARNICRTDGYVPRPCALTKRVIEDVHFRCEQLKLS